MIRPSLRIIIAEYQVRLPTEQVIKERLEALADRGP